MIKTHRRIRIGGFGRFANQLRGWACAAWRYRDDPAVTFVVVPHWLDRGLRGDRVLIPRTVIGLKEAYAETFDAATADLPEEQWPRLLRSVRPAPALAAVLPAPALAGTWLGLHARRGDFDPPGPAAGPFVRAPDELFARRVRSRPPGPVFLATDGTTAERDALAALLRADGREVVFGDADDGPRDFFTLARCREIIASPLSTFAPTAALYGGIPCDAG